MLVFHHQCPQFCQLMISKAFGICQLNGIEPEFCRLITMLDMDMGRFLIFSAEKEKSETELYLER